MSDSMSVTQLPEPVAYAVVNEADQVAAGGLFHTRAGALGECPLSGWRVEPLVLRSALSAEREARTKAQKDFDELYAVWSIEHPELVGLRASATPAVDLNKLRWARMLCRDLTEALTVNRLGFSEAEWQAPMRLLDWIEALAGSSGYVPARDVEPTDTEMLDWWFARGIEDSVCEGSVDLWWATEINGDATTVVTHGTSVRDALQRAMRGEHDDV